MMSWTRYRVLTLFNFLYFSVSIYLVSGLFEDQINEFDWLQQQFGRVKDCVYQPKTPKHLYCSTFQNVITKINSKDGVIRWRHVLPEGENINAIKITSSGLITISGNGSFIRMWDVTDGTLVWDYYSGLSVSQMQDNSNIFSAFIDDSSIVVGSTKMLIRLNIIHGSVAWKWQIPEANESIEDISTNAGSTSLYVITSKDREKKMYELDCVKGLVESQDTLLNVADETQFQIHQNDESELLRVSLNTEGTQITLHDNKNGLVRKSFKDFVPTDPSDRFHSFIGSSRNFIGVKTAKGRILLLRISDDGSIVPLHGDYINQSGCVGEARSLSGKSFIVHSEIVDRKQISVVLHDVSGEIVEQVTKNLEEIGLDSHGNRIEHITPIIFEKKNGDIAVRYLIVCEDHTLITIYQGKVLWKRDEALASIKQVEWVTPSEEGERETPKLPSLLDSIQFNVKKLQSVLMSDSLNSWLEGSRNAKSHFFGFRKLLVVLTYPGKLYALDSETGRIIWSKLLDNASDIEYQLIITRDHPGMGIGPEVLIIGKSNEPLNEKVSAKWIDADTGEEIEKSYFPSTIKHVFLLPFHKQHLEDATDNGEKRTIGRRAVVFVDDNLNLHLFPNTPETLEALNRDSRTLFFNWFDPKENTFSGYRVSLQKNNTYKALKIWVVVLSQTESIVSITRMPNNEVIESPVAITGDDSLLLKYLNPHLFSIATKDIESDELIVSIIDSVSGRIIHRISHKHSSSRVSMILMENWLVYTYWNSKLKRTELVSVALFDGAIGPHGISLWKRPPYSTIQSSFSSKLPVVLQKAFIFPGGVRSLSPTFTAKGITPKHVLVALSTGQIYSLDRNLIDPRRPDGAPKPEHAREGLLQYFPYVPIWHNPLSMVSYNKTIANVRGITATSASLESTSLMFAYGLDLFYARVTPAKSFDLLPSDFNYVLLIMLTTGLLLATFILRFLVERKKLHDGWK